MQYLVQAHVKHVLQENMQKEGLLNVKNVNQEQFPMPHHQVVLFFRRECIRILEVQHVLDVPSNKMKMYIVMRLEERDY